LFVPNRQSNRVSLGIISKTRGLKGEVVVTPLATSPKTLLTIREVFLLPEKPPFIIEKVRQFKNKVLLKLKGIDTPEQAQSLVGKYLEVEKESIKHIGFSSTPSQENIESVLVFADALKGAGTIKNSLTRDDVFDLRYIR